MEILSDIRLQMIENGKNGTCWSDTTLSENVTNYPLLLHVAKDRPSFLLSSSHVI